MISLIQASLNLTLSMHHLLLSLFQMLIYLSYLPPLILHIPFLLLSYYLSLIISMLSILSPSILLILVISPLFSIIISPPILYFIFYTSFDVDSNFYNPILNLLTSSLILFIFSSNNYLYKSIKSKYVLGVKYIFLLYYK